VLVLADASQLGRVLDNLLNNGLSYTHETPDLKLACGLDNRLAPRIEALDHPLGPPVGHGQGMNHDSPE